MDADRNMITRISVWRISNICWVSAMVLVCQPLKRPPFTTHS